MARKGKTSTKGAAAPELSPADSESEEDDSSVSVYDSDVPSYGQHPDGSSEEEFEDQGSSDEDEEVLRKQEQDSDSDDDDDDGMQKVDGIEVAYAKSVAGKRGLTGTPKPTDEKSTAWMHTDDLSSDDEDEGGVGNRIGRVPLHWYDDYEHIGYNANGKKVAKSSSADNGDRIDQALANAENAAKGKYVVHDALNDKNIELSARQLELIRRIQGGAYAHPEFDANPDYIDYFSGVNPEISGLNADRYLPKSKFQPSKWEKMQVDKLLEKLKNGHISMDYLTGKVRDMNDVKKKGSSDEPFLLWTGAEEDELNMRKGPQHVAAPKLPPPGHAESYIPPDEYLPTEEDKGKWDELDPQDRPHGMMVPQKFPNLRSVGAYKHSVRETFERCLDLYLCPRVMKRRLNIDPESLVPKLPKASDLKPYPTVKCIEYKTPHGEDEEAPMIRCCSPSPNGQYVASGAADGVVRLWEVETGRLLRSWNLSAIALSLQEGQAPDSSAVKPVASLQWNPNRSHHCILAAVGKCAFILASGTEGAHEVDVNIALLSACKSGSKLEGTRAAKAVKWMPQDSLDKPVSAKSPGSGVVCVLVTGSDMAQVRWHSKGDYFVTVSPKSGASAVLIHQLSKANSQQPFSKAKGESQRACFHPNKPFLFVASQQHVRVYNLVKQTMVKRLLSGCRWISSIDVHPSGDHIIVGSLDRRMIWFDLDLSNTPYKTLKYHERALRCVQYHRRYPLMASGSDDGSVHIFHSMVYSDLMRNPLVVPVKILRAHSVSSKYGVLDVAFHPLQPWVFTCGADGRMFLFQDI